jgi:signal transduction histidine kinase/DNA-binding NarL/FixJ family response regulator
MLVAGTQMHIVTFLFVSIEIVILFYLIIYKLARPDDNKTSLNIWLVSLLLTYNITGGLLPDPNLPGSLFIQEVIAYATGFITPSYFPYYVYKAFELKKMRFHAHRGVFLCLMLPFFCFVIVYAISSNLKTAQTLLILPVLYAAWVIHSLAKAFRYKYHGDFKSKEAKEEIIVLFLSLTPWVSLPIIVYFDLPQSLEASVTNSGFLLLLGLQLKNHIAQLRKEHHRLMDSEIQLLNWNTNLQLEVEKRTRELETINEQRANTFVNLAHETKTPLTLIKNYLEEYIDQHGNTEDLKIIKGNIDKLTSDISNLFDLERFIKGLTVFNHNQVTNFSEVISDSLALFKRYSNKRDIELNANVETNVFIKADPLSITRILNNLVENAIKFSDSGGVIEVSLKSDSKQIFFSVKDRGIGIPPEMHKKIFEPYYQINRQKRNNQGMGLGLPIVQKVIQTLHGEIHIDSNPLKRQGTKITVVLDKFLSGKAASVSYNGVHNNTPLNIDIESLDNIETVHDENKKTILIVEDNISMVNYLARKLGDKFNTSVALNGNEALKKIKSVSGLPDLIISDIMMDKLDGFTFARIISEDAAYNHIPFIFLSAKSAQTDKLQGLKLGAIDFIHKPFSIQELIQKVESVLAVASKQKKAVLSVAIDNLNLLQGGPFSHNKLNGLDKFEQNCQLYNLTAREKGIARLICEGHKYKEIGDILFIAERTVTKHAQNIFEKVQVSNKIELVNKLAS